MGHLAPPMGPSTALEAAALERALSNLEMTDGLDPSRPKSCSDA